MSHLGPETDSEDELPVAWEERVSPEGVVYYINHQDQSTQWQHPRTKKMKRVTGSLPFGWEKKIESDGRVIFINTEKNIQSFTDPRLAFAQEEASGTSIRQKFDGSSTALSILHGKDLSGKVALITGSNVGIGLETAKSLAFHGCEIIMANRNEKSTLEAIEVVQSERSDVRLKFMKLDLSSLQNCKKFCQDVKIHFRKLDFLILNAGVFALPFSLTEDNFETTFQVCHLAHFFITQNLSELLDHSSRVIVLSSESHRFANFPKCGLTREHLCPPSSKFWSMMAYNNVKLCNVLFANELSRKWQKRGISVFAVHPGNMISTNIQRNYWFYKLLFCLVRPFTKSLQQAAATTIYSATAQELTGLTGAYFNNCYVCEPSKLSQNEILAKELWILSEKMIEEAMEGVRGREGV